MPILGDRTELSARVFRAKSNALIVTCTDPSGNEVAVGKQKGGAAVLFGFKNGGKAGYTVEGSGGQLDVTVAATTKVARNDQPLGSIVGEGSRAHIESAGASVLAKIEPYAGSKGDAAFMHPLTAADGSPLGTLTLMRSVQGWSIADFVSWTATWDMTGLGMKTPSAGALLTLTRPVDDILGDLLVAALVDMCTLPRGYVS
jgi:hypothetical protein